MSSIFSNVNQSLSSNDNPSMTSSVNVDDIDDDDVDEVDDDINRVLVLVNVIKFDDIRVIRWFDR